MTKNTITRRIVFYQIAGFALIILFLWFSEIFDLPHTLFGAPATPVNLVESLYESLLVLFLAAAVTASTLRFMARIRYLEGFLPVCSHCRRIRLNDDWIHLDEFIQNNTAAEVSHGLCPDCMRRYYNIPSKKEP